MRGFRSFSSNKSYASTLDKVISGLSCYTFGFVGFIWIIIAHVRKQSLSPFVRYNTFLPILVFFIIYVATLIINIFEGFVQILPIIGSFFVNLVYFIRDYKLVMGQSFVNLIIIGLQIYMTVHAVLGKYAEIPKFSDFVRRMV